MHTKQIVATTGAQPLHFLSESALMNVAVSTRSLWCHPVWYLDNASHGQRNLSSRLTWEVELGGGEKLTDQRHAVLLSWLRRFIWSLFTDPRDKARPYKAGNALPLSQALRYVVPWMVERGISLPHQLTRTEVNAYIEDLPAIVAGAVEDEPELSASVLTLPLKLIDLMWKQRSVFVEMGMKPMAEAPWDAKAAHVVARGIATKVRGWIQPLPDEVAIPVLNRAAWFLGAPAERILGLVERLETDRDLSAESEHPRQPGSKLGFNPKYVQHIRDFEATAMDESGRPLVESIWLPRKKSKSMKNLTVAALIKTLTAACTIVLQSSTGIRSSEVCGLKGGINSETGLPTNVKMTLSSSGLYEIFTLTGLMSKSESVPIEVEWLLAMRPVGSSEVPLPVRAIVVLERLLRGARKARGTDSLLITWIRGPGLQERSNATAEFTNFQLNAYSKDFVVREVDLRALPDESRHRVAPDDLVPWRESSGGILRPHQFRPTFAHFVLAVDTRLLPAVQRQFHHVNMAMTEQGYWGANRLQVEPLDSVSQQMVARRIYELATGRSVAAGKRGEALQNQLDEVTWLIEGKGVQEGWRSVLRYVKGNHVDMWFSEHGDCFPTSLSQMECHKRAGTRPLARLVPNYEARAPSLCSGCRCYLVDMRHRSFHEKRLVENTRAANESVVRADGLARIASARANASRKLLAAMGVGEEELLALEGEAIEGVPRAA